MLNTIKNHLKIRKALNLISDSYSAQIDLTVHCTLIAGTVYRSPSIVRYLEASPVALDSPSSDRIVLGLRDQQLLEAYVLGLNNREVAERLNLSVRTVQTYSGQLLQRLGVNNRQKAILRAIEIGISLVPKYFQATSP